MTQSPSREDQIFSDVGRPVDKNVERPFYFTKAPQTLIPSCASVAYPPETSNYNFEMEMVVVIGKTGFRVKAEVAHHLICGYTAGLDMTRRDLLLAARDKGRPWDLGKDVEQYSVCSEIVAMEGVAIDSGNIDLEVNGQTKESSNLDKLIWIDRENIADFSLFYHLQPGDQIYTCTTEGVGAVVAGEKTTGRVEGVAEVSLNARPCRIVFTS